MDGTGHQEAVDDAAEVLVFVVESIAIEPCCTLLGELSTQRDMLGRNKFDEAADRCERVAGADSDEHVVAFTGVHVGLGRFNKCPGQAGCLCVSHCNYRVSAVSQWR